MQKNKTLLITGGTGSFGNAVLRRFPDSDFVREIRNTRAIDVVRELEQFGCRVDVYDPRAGNAEVMHEYGLKLAEGNGGWKVVNRLLAVGNSHP